MQKHGFALTTLAIAAWLVAWPVAAQTDETDEPATDQVEAGQLPKTGQVPPAVQLAPAPGEPTDPPPRRLKALKTTIGVPPTAQDVGSEADLLASGVGDAAGFATTLNKWTLRMKGYVRAPLRVGLGDRNDETSGNELHVPPRIIGLSSGTWEYIALAPNPSVSLYFNYGNPLVSANVIFNTNTLIDAGYRNLDQIGGISAAYLTLKFPDAFGSHGGLSWTVGAFGNRYGLAGPRGTSSGYYGTYLFGRLHQTGEVLTLNVDLSDRLELVVEHGLGAKLEVIPFIAGDAPEADYFQGQGKGAQSSTFVHHAHVGLYVDDWLKVGYHYLTSWTPDDNSGDNVNLCFPAVAGRPPECREPRPVDEARLTVIGADMHIDGDRMGNGYIGYSHVRGDNLYPLGDGVQAIHASTGRSFKENYFGRKDPTDSSIAGNVSGDIDTLLFQYIFRLSALMDRPLGAREVSLSAFSMYNHVRSPIEDPTDRTQEDINTDKLKLGGEVMAELHKHMSLGVRYDLVMPDVDDLSGAYEAVSPRMILYTRRKSKEYIILNYTHYWLGDRAYPGSPYADIPVRHLKADRHMFMLSAVMSFGP